MADIVRKGGLVEIWAEEAGKPHKTRVASMLCGRPNHRNLRFYDVGNDMTYTSDYSIGGAKSRARVFLESPDSLRVAFVAAGIPVPTTIGLKWIGYAYRAAHAMHRSVVRGTRSNAPAQTIR